MNICIFCEKWESGGIESFLSNILLNADFRNLQVDIVAVAMRESVFTNPLRAKGVKFIQLSGNLYALRRNYRLFQKLLAEKAYDIFYLNAYHAMSLYYLRLSKSAGVSVRIAHSHNTELRESCTKPLKMALHFLFRRLFAGDATALFACSKSAARFLFSPEISRGRQWHFIPDAIDPERFRFQAEQREKARLELGLTGQFVVGNVGRLCRQKNQGFLLTAFREVLRQRPESVLLLIGEGESRKQLKRQSERLGISEKVIFCGASANIERALWAMDAFAFPSQFEGFGMVVIEAQATGLPVICSEHIPEEAAISSAFRRISLREGAKKWGQAIAAVSCDAGKRSAGADAVYRAGYDMNSATRIFQGGWRNAR